MAITNYERVGKARDLLKEGLGPFIERELKARYGNSWAVFWRVPRPISPTGH